MIAAARSLVVATGWLVQRLMFASVALLGLGSLAYTLACAFGYAPWLEMTATFGGIAYPEAGQVVQIGLTALLVGLCVFLPANARIMALETSHRKFHITMEDVARAYRFSHASDRDGVFKMKSEFDSVRERMAYLRDHPDLAELEPSVLEIASQMSHVSRDLADTYSDASVNRARDFLIQRQQEIEEFNARLAEAKATAAEMRVWADKVDLEESVAQAQLDRLNEELSTILPELHNSDAAPSIPPRSAPAQSTQSPDTANNWDDAAEFPDNDDNRIVALLARRAAE
ncbi:DNA repair protein [Marivita sp. S6314]|uniref:DNA repair protein n=1 Tax=Marivita sp. S6314 TaxID=2926406 RepID=UPI001FF17312|nr:DNA repair protein [Marivita sp. S6314]MCK0150927.1 DNA repair protein [Marivita sp. S6314]